MSHVPIPISQYPYSQYLNSSCSYSQYLNILMFLFPISQYPTVPIPDVSCSYSQYLNIHMFLFPMSHVPIPNISVFSCSYSQYLSIHNGEVRPYSGKRTLAELQIYIDESEWQKRKPYHGGEALLLNSKVMV